jgi:putative lipoprotein
MIRRAMGMAAFALAGLLAEGATAQGQADKNVVPAMKWKRFDYTCGGGAKLTVYLHDQTVKVNFQDKQYLMTQTRSADGARYSDGKVLWWGKGNGGFLQEDVPDGEGKMILKDCQLDKPLNAQAGTVTGTVTYLQRMALPPGAVIEVKLQDMSLADAPAKVIAEQKITPGQKQVPVAFELKFDPAKIAAKNRYSVSARILVDGQLRFISDPSYPVVTGGNPSHVEMILKPVGGPGPR